MQANDIKQLLYQTTRLQIATQMTGSRATYFQQITQQMAILAEFTTVRTDFLSPETVINTQTLGLQLRLLFDGKRRPRTEWSNQRYLRQHKRLLDAYHRKHSDFESSSSSTDRS